MAWNISTAKRRALVKLQLRDKNGRWIEMGGGVKWYSSKRKKVIAGTVVGTSGSSALVRLNKENPTHEPELVKVPAHNIEVVDSKASLNPKAPEAPSADQTSEFEKPEDVSLETKERTPYVKPSDTPEDYSITDTPDGHTYVSRKDGQQLYFPARQLDVGDELLAPDGGDPTKPFSMGKSWAKKGAERLNTAGPKTGKVVAIEGDRYAVVQLPEGHTVDDKRNPGEQTDKVTVGLSNSVIKLTPGIKSALKDKLDENFTDTSEQDGEEEVIDADAPENVSDHIGREVTDEQLAEDDDEAGTDPEAPEEVPVDEDAPVADPDEEAAAEAERKARDEDLAQRAAERQAALDAMGDQYNDEGLNEAEVKMIEAYERMANRALDNMEDDRADNFLAKAEEIRETGRQRLEKAGVPEEEPKDTPEDAPEQPEKAPESTPEPEKAPEESTAEEDKPVIPGEGMPTLFSTTVRGNTRGELEYFDEVARESEQDQGYRMVDGKFEVYDFDRAESSIADAIDIWESKQASAAKGGFSPDSPAKVRAVLKGLADLDAKVKAARQGNNKGTEEPKEPAAPNLVEPDVSPEAEQPSLLDGVQDEIPLPGVRKQSKRDNAAKHLKTLNGLEEGDRVSYTNAHDETVTFQKHADGTWDELDMEDDWESPIREAIPAQEIADRYKRNELEIQTAEDREQAEKDERFARREKGPSYMENNPDPVRPTGRTEPNPEPMDYSDSADQPWSADDIESNVSKWYDVADLISEGKLDADQIRRALEDETFIAVNDKNEPFDVSFVTDANGKPVVRLGDFNDSKKNYGDWEIDKGIPPHHLAAKIHEAINSDDPEESVKQSNGLYDYQEEAANEAFGSDPKNFKVNFVRKSNGLEGIDIDNDHFLTDEEREEFRRIDSRLQYAQHSNRRADESAARNDARALERAVQKRLEEENNGDNGTSEGPDNGPQDSPEPDAPETPDAEPTPEADTTVPVDTPEDAPEQTRAEDSPESDDSTDESAPTTEEASPEDEVHPLDALGIERRTPEAIEGESYPPTQQQQDVIDAVLGGLDTKVQAMAGTGKTSTLVAVSRRIKEAGKQAIYIAFNKTVQQEAEERMAGLPVEAKTGHGVAYQWALKNAPHLIARLNGGDPTRPIKFDKNGKATDWETKRAITANNRIAGLLDISNGDAKNEEGEDMRASSIVLAVKKTVEKYSLSDKDDIGIEHVPDSFEIHEDSKQAVVDFAKKYWEDLTEESGNFRITHDAYRKMWALSRPDLTDGSGGNKPGANLLYIDEAQDTPPVLAKVVADQKMQKVIVGDPNQAIYAFAENIDYLSEAEGDVSLPLNKSWRFGPQVADIGNRFLEFLGSDDRVVGGGGDSAIVNGMEDADAVLVRTNAGMLSEILREVSNGRRVSAPNGTREDLTKLVKTVQGLMNGEVLESPHDDLIGYSNWDKVLKAWNDGDTSLNKIVNLFDVVDSYSLARLKPSEIEAQKRRKMENALKAIDSLVVKVPKSEGIEITKEGDRTWLSPKDEHPDPAMASKWHGPAKQYAVKNFSQEIGKLRAPEAFDKSLSWGQQMDAYHKAGGIGTMGFRWDSKSGRWYTDDVEAGQKISTFFGESDVTISTAHRSKGLEWDRVRIGDDFFIPREDPKTGELVFPEDPAEYKLGYVAVTRAAKELDPGVLGWIYEHTSENGGDPKKKKAPAPDTDATPEQISDDEASDVNAGPETEESLGDVADTSEPVVDSTPVEESDYDQDGLTPTEAARAAELDEEIAKVYRGESDADIVELENEWDDIMRHGSRRLKGEDLPEWSKPEPVQISEPVEEPTPSITPEPVPAPEPELSPETTEEPELDAEGLTPEERQRADQLEQWIYDIYRGKGQGNVKAMDDELTAILTRGAERLKPKPVEEPKPSPAPKRQRESYKDVPVLDANGAEIKLGDTVGHRRLGPVVVTGFLPGAGRVQYIDPTTNRTASVKGDNVSVIPDSVDSDVEEVVGQPGERFTDPLSGKKGFFNGEGVPTITGQRVQNREGRTGVVTGVYRGADGLASVPVLWDDTGKVTRVKGVTLSLEDDGSGGPDNGPEDVTPPAPEVPDTTPEPEAPIEVPAVESRSLREILEGYDGQSDVATGYNPEISAANPLSAAGIRMHEELKGRLTEIWAEVTDNFAFDKDGNPVTHGVKIYNPTDGKYLGIVSHIEGSATGNYNLKTLSTERAWEEFDPKKVTTVGKPWDTSEDLDFSGLQWDDINAKLERSYPSVKFEIDESLDLDIAQEYARLVSKMFNRYPMLQHLMDNVTSQARGGNAIAAVFHAPLERSTHPHMGLNLNSAKNNLWGRTVPVTMDSIIKEARESADSGWFHKFPEGKELEATISHEMAHALDGLTGWTPDARIQDLVEQYLAERDDRGAWSLRQYLMDHREVSQYSFGAEQEGIDTREFIAEAFSDVEVNGINAKPLSKLIHRELINRLKGLTNDWA